MNGRLVAHVNNATLKRRQAFTKIIENKNFFLFFFFQNNTKKQKNKQKKLEKSPG